MAFIEIAGLTPTLVAVDRCSKSASVRVIGIESSTGAEQCIKLAGPPDDVREAAERAVRLAAKMGSRADVSIMTGPTEETHALANRPPEFIPLLGINDSLVKKEGSMSSSDAIGLIETQGLVSALHATDEMLKGSAVQLVGKEKIGAAYVTIIVRGDVAAVQSAIETGRQAVERLGGKLIMADVIARPHPELAALLPS